MTRFEEGSVGWTLTKEIVRQSKELEEDLRRLHAMITAASDYYAEIYGRYCDLPCWELLHDKTSMAIGWPEILLEVMPEEE